MAFVRTDSGAPRKPKLDIGTALRIGRSARRIRRGLRRRKTGNKVY